MMGMQRPMLLNISIQSTFQTFLCMNSNSKSAHLSFCYTILVHLLDCAMEHAFMSPASVRESLNAKYLVVCDRGPRYSLPMGTCFSTGNSLVINNKFTFKIKNIYLCFLI